MFRFGSYLFVIFCTLGVILGHKQARAAGAFDALSRDQQLTLLSGNSLSIYPPTQSWPKCQIYQWVPTTPEEAAGIFFDYSLQKNYVHRVAKSDILPTRLGAKTSEVAYGLRLAPLLATFFPAPEYRVFSHIDRISSAAPGYEVRWNLSKTGFLKDLKGAARFEPVEDGTLISYWSVLEPSYLPYALAPSYVIEAMKRGCREALESVATHIKAVKTENPEYVEERVRVLNSTLGSP